MKKTKIFIILILITSAAQTADLERNSFYIELEFNKSEDNMNVDMKTAEFRQVTTDSTFYNTRENISLRLETKTGKKTFKGKLPVSFLTYTNTYPPSTPNASKTTELEVYPPYNKSSARALILHDSEVIGNFSLTEEICVEDGTCSSYCEDKGVDVDCTCGDGVCQESANEKDLCPEDCGSDSNSGGESNQENDNSNEESINDSADTVEVVDSGYNTNLLVVIGILTILFAVILASSKVKIEA